MNDNPTVTERSELRMAERNIANEFEEWFKMKADENQNSVDYYKTTPNTEILRFAKAFLRIAGEIGERT